MNGRDVKATFNGREILNLGGFIESTAGKNESPELTPYRWGPFTRHLTLDEYLELRRRRDARDLFTQYEAAGKPYRGYPYPEPDRRWVISEMSEHDCGYMIEVTLTFTYVKAVPRRRPRRRA